MKNIRLTPYSGKSVLFEPVPKNGKCPDVLNTQ